MFSVLVAVCLLSIALIQPAFAYLDPGTGSMIIQIIIGTFIAALAAGKYYWSKIKEFFFRLKDRLLNKSIDQSD